MNKKIILSLSFFALIVIISLALINEVFARDCPGYATACGSPLVYKVTMNELEISTTGGETGAVTVVSAPQQFDIASKNAGQQVGSWFSGAALPPGTYNWMRRTVSTTFYAQGYVRATVAGFGDLDWYTSSNPDTATYGASTNLRTVVGGTFPGNPPVDYAEVAFVAEEPPAGYSLPAGMSFSGNNIIEEDTSMTITIAHGITTTMRVTFNVGNTLQLQQTGPASYQFYISEPDVDATIIYQ